MIEIVKKTMEFYFKNFKTPTTSDLNIIDSELLENSWSIFVTLYKSWEIRWAAWNMKEIKLNIAEELIENTITAISKDTRFEPISLDESKDLKIRIDNIINRVILQDNEILQIDPLKLWILAIKKDYSFMATILPNINSSILTWEDLIPILANKFNTKIFKQNDYILYKIKTEVFDNFDVK